MKLSKFNAAETFRDELAFAMAQSSGEAYQRLLPYAEAVVRHLQQQYGGDELYIPLPYNVCDEQDVVAAKERGMSIAEICKTFRISRRTYYRRLSGLCQMT